MDFYRMVEYIFQVVKWENIFLWQIWKHLKFVVVSQILHCCFLAHHCLHSSPFHLSSHSLFLFNTDDDPDTKNSSFHLPPASSGQGLMERGQGGESQPSSIWKILSAGCLQPLLCQRCPSKWLCHDNPVPIKSTVLVTPQATWSTSEGRRQTDWLHSLSLGHYTALSNPVYPFIFLLLLFSYTPFLSQRPSTPIAFLVNNTPLKRWVMAEWEERGWEKREGVKRRRRIS